MPTGDGVKKVCALAGVVLVLAALGFACGGDEPPPVASFSLDVPSGSAPYTVQFMDTSQGPITSWQWDFGDGASSTEQNPTHEYTVAGSSTVRLTVTGPGGIDVTTLPEAINVDPGPLAEVVGSPTQIALQVQRTAPLGVRAVDQFGNEISDTAFTWSTQGLAPVGSIGETGLFTTGTQSGTYNGLVQVTATQGTENFTALIDVTITPGPLSSIAVEPDEITLNIGAAQPFIFAAFDEFGNGIADVLAAWAMPEDVGTLDGRGLFRAGTRAGTFPGAIRVDVVKGSERVSATVDVSIRPDPLDTIGVQPVFIFANKGVPQQFTAVALDQYGNEIPGLAFLWEAMGGQIDQAGLFTADQIGRSEVRASVTVGGRARVGTATVEKSIKFWDGQFGSLSINNALAQFVIEHGYGYAVEQVPAFTAEMQEALPRGSIHVNMEGWQQSNLGWYNREVAKGAIENLGMTYESGSEFFVIPLWVHEQYGINTVEDMKQHWELFKAPGDASKGTFYDCVVGSQCVEYNTVKLEAYGLDKFYNIISPGSFAAVEDILAGHQEDRKPVFGYYWAPTTLMGAYDWWVLEEPAYTKACWDLIEAARTDPSLRPISAACAYETALVDKLVWSGLEEGAPDVWDLLKNMDVGLDQINETLAWAVENQIGDDWEKAAIHYLRTYLDRAKSWMPEENWERVTEALDKAG